MSITFPGSIDGSAQTGGFTSPKFVTTADSGPEAFSKQVAILSATGTVPGGVKYHSVSSPFTVAYWRPKVYQILGKPNQLTGLIDRVPVNKHKFILRKGVTVAAGQPPRVMVIRTEIDVPSGAETFDIDNVKAALSAHFGALNNMSSGIGETVNNGVI